MVVCFNIDLSTIEKLETIPWEQSSLAQEDSIEDSIVFIVMTACSMVVPISIFHALGGGCSCMCSPQNLQ